MRSKKIQTVDSNIDPTPITLTVKQRSDLAAAIPFHRGAGEQERMASLGEEVPGPIASGTSFLRKKGKWHTEHDVFRGEGTFDTDILINSPTYKKSIGNESL